MTSNNMFAQHFHLAASPFHAGPDPQFLYLTDTVWEALACLAYGVTNRKGFVQLTGDVGTGKTTILNVFLKWLQEEEASTAVIFNPHLQPNEFIEVMMSDFGLELNGASKSQLLLTFNRWLLDRYYADRLVVLFVDEAQQLSAEVLEELRLFTNLETPTNKLLQIVLCGQPELETILANPSLRQLRQRIALRCKTAPFSQEQTREYVLQRLRIAGSNDREIFDSQALARVHEISGGIARIINSVCEEAMIEAFCDASEKVTKVMVENAARTLVLSRHVPEEMQLGQVSREERYGIVCHEEGTEAFAGDATI